MMNMLSTDIDNCRRALEEFIINEENYLHSRNASDLEWSKLDTYKDTLTNLNYLRAIYG